MPGFLIDAVVDILYPFREEEEMLSFWCAG
jgi:hypothetical protein